MIYVTYPSALDFWLNWTGRQHLKQPYIYEDFNPDIAESNVKKLEIYLPAPATIMVASKNERKVNSRYNYVSVHNSFPGKCFVRLTENLCIASPELCFLLASGNYTFSQFVELGNCLCAGYVYDASQKYLQRSRQPITTTGQIQKFVDTAQGCHGVVKARIAARYICDNSGSPMENRSASIYFIPRHYGGYRFRSGELNGYMNLTEQGYKILGSPKCRGDVVWNEWLTCAEYDSSMTHENIDQMQQDARRQTAMNASNYKVVRFTKDTISNFDKFEARAMLIWDNLEMHKMDKSLKKYTDRRRGVFNELFIQPHPFFRT